MIESPVLDLLGQGFRFRCPKCDCEDLQRVPRDEFAKGEFIVRCKKYKTRFRVRKESERFVIVGEFDDDAGVDEPLGDGSDEVQADAEGSAIRASDLHDYD
ncbi:MAG: hypothetical protein F4Y02_07855 [Chloroflexi bacterium]|nr:hypothetical protein [Chloroflexota bacterium]